MSAKLGIQYETNQQITQVLSPFAHRFPSFSSVQSFFLSILLSLGLVKRTETSKTTSAATEGGGEDGGRKARWSA